MKRNSFFGVHRQFSFALIFLVPLMFGLFPPKAPQEATCLPPNVTITSQSPNSVCFSWDAVGGSTEYAVWYVRENDNYTSSPIYTGNTSIAFTGLSAGTYNFYFTTVCGMDRSDGIIIEELVMF
ncbi:MAG: fibronectin type III domain-containing protein [Saprospiraceae bacterium]|nr:fibronectin type III domain-containing protein [Saprospiraceae bacterium]